MKKFFSLLMVFVITLVGFWTLPIATAQNNTDNPFLNPAHHGQSAGVSVIGAGTGKNDSLITVVKNGINWVLGILALIALIILLWGGFQMVTAAGDEEKYKKGFTILKQAAIGLILIGIAWFVISIIFWLINLIATPAQDAGTGV